PKSNSPSGLSAHWDHTRPLRVLVTSPFMGLPPTMLSTGPAPVGASAAMANSVVSMPNAVNAATTAISMAFGIPSPSSIKNNSHENRWTPFQERRILRNCFCDPKNQDYVRFCCISLCYWIQCFFDEKLL